MYTKPLTAKNIKSSPATLIANVFGAVIELENINSKNYFKLVLRSPMENENEGIGLNTQTALLAYSLVESIKKNIYITMLIIDPNTK
jgi:hypothetical protein